MFLVDENEKVIYLIPGQGWRIVLAQSDDDEGAEPTITESRALNIPFFEARALAMREDELMRKEGNK